MPDPHKNSNNLACLAEEDVWKPTVDAIAQEKSDTLYCLQDVLMADFVGNLTPQPPGAAPQNR